MSMWPALRVFWGNAASNRGAINPPPTRQQQQSRCIITSPQSHAQSALSRARTRTCRRRRCWPAPTLPRLPIRELEPLQGSARRRRIGASSSPGVGCVCVFFAQWIVDSFCWRFDYAPSHLVHSITLRFKQLYEAEFGGLGGSWRADVGTDDSFAGRSLFLCGPLTSVFLLVLL